jgi:hypothetical protein
MVTQQDIEMRQAGVPPFTRVYHQDPRDRLLMLYGVWVKCLPHQAGRRRLVERCISQCKAQIEARKRLRCTDCGAELTQPVGQAPWPCAHCVGELEEDS